MKRENFKVYLNGVYVFEQRWVKSKKDHKCTHCQKYTIIKGDKYFRAKVMNPILKEPQTEKFCYICVSEMAECDFDAVEEKGVEQCQNK